MKTIQFLVDARRALLDAASLFKTSKQVVWEYVANGLQYVKPGIIPNVEVTMDTKARKITIRDNGRGMDLAGLENFFVLHGENQDLKDPRVLWKRGARGTGKTAGLSIARSFTITTVKDGKLWKAQLNRKDIEEMPMVEKVPVNLLKAGIPTDEPNGTVVEISDIQIGLDEIGTRQYIEKHLWHFPGKAKVTVNGQVCKPHGPVAISERTFMPTPKEAKVLGRVELTVQVARQPLEKDEIGIAVVSGGVLHAITLAGLEGQEMSGYLFGKIEIPRLAKDTSQPAAFDSSRSMTLNIENRLVRALYTFIARSVDEVRQGLVEDAREKRKSLENRKLQKHASGIEKVLNADFVEFQDRLNHKISSRRDLIHGNAVHARIVGEVPAAPQGTNPDRESNSGGERGGSGEASGEPRMRPVFVKDPNSEEMAGYGARRRVGPSFKVNFDSLGEDGLRCAYKAETRTILINKDHPKLRAAIQEHGLDSVQVQQMSSEVAMAEYALALVGDLQNYGFLDLTEMLPEIRKRWDEVARKTVPM